METRIGNVRLKAKSGVNPLKCFEAVIVENGKLTLASFKMKHIEYGSIGSGPYVHCFTSAFVYRRAA